jgi:hypothetical protein
MGSVHHYTRFGFAAVPDTTVFGKFVFIVNEASTIYRTSTTGPARLGTSTPPGVAGIVPGYQIWPDDNTMKSNWSKLD